MLDNPAPGNQSARPRSLAAFSSFVIGIASLFPVLGLAFSIISIALALIGLRQIEADKLRGRQLAQVGIGIAIAGITLNTFLLCTLSRIDRMFNP
jgi:hypothetical protein